MFSRLHSKFFLILALTLLLSTVYYFFVRDTYKPLHRLAANELPFFSDDLDIDSLIQSGTRQQAYLARQAPETIVHFGKDSYEMGWLQISLERFLTKLRDYPDSDELNAFLHDNFVIYQAGGRRQKKNREMLVTGYYEPVFEGSLERTPPYLTPIYAPPDSLITRKIATGSEIGRYDENNNFVPFWSREEIETGGHLKGFELAYMRDPLDAFLLHVQGSGRIRLPDGTLRTVRFNGSNGLEYKSIGKLLVDEKVMKLKEANIPAIRAHLTQSPDEMKRVLHHNPRFIFFSWGDNLGPRGSSGEILTPGRSVALDASSLPAPAIGYLQSRKPLLNGQGHVSGWSPLGRFVFPQDSGSAIKGTGRIDIFWGAGPYAEAAASHMQEAGKLYFFVMSPSLDRPNM